MHKHDTYIETSITCMIYIDKFISSMTHKSAMSQVHKQHKSKSPQASTTSPQAKEVARMVVAPQTKVGTTVVWETSVTSPATFLTYSMPPMDSAEENRLHV